ncbi:MAG: hypothetical protein RBT75_17090, partial [Anaerolineae bacterium]|nr:hypothetical protein [Anaerolineae bacterium]
SRSRYSLTGVAAGREWVLGSPYSGPPARNEWAFRPGSTGAAETPHRNPLLLFVSVGVFLLRFAPRVLFSLLFHEPPRSTSGPIPTTRTVAGSRCLSRDLPRCNRAVR